VVAYALEYITQCTRPQSINRNPHTTYFSSLDIDRMVTIEA